MREEIVYLEPRGAFHLGERGIGLEGTAEIVHADTLHAALTVAWALLFGAGAVAEILNPTAPPFLLSSAFPFAGPVRFYPRPFLPLPPAMAAQPEAYASLKDVAFVSEGVLAHHLRGDPFPPVEAVQDGRALLLKEEMAALQAALNRRSPEAMRLWQVATVPRVALDVVTARSNIWNFGRVMFYEGAGYFFRVRYRRPELADRFRAAVRLLGDTGLGGDRSSGHGLFRPRFEPADPLGTPDSDRFVTLAPVYPPHHQVAALLGAEARYRWLTRGGWISGVTSTPYRRRTVRLLAEGAVLTGDPKELWGALVDVTPEATPEPLPHRVYRYGFAFPVGVPTWKP